MEQWEQDFDAATKLVDDLKTRIAPLRHVRDEISGIERKLSKLQREEERAASNLQSAQSRLKDEQARYQKSGLANRRALLKAGATRELERVFGSLPRVLEPRLRTCWRALRDSSRNASREASDRHRASLAAEIDRRTELARAADSGRAKRRAARVTLHNALETFLRNQRPRSHDSMNVSNRSPELRDQVIALLERSRGRHGGSRSTSRR